MREYSFRGGQQSCFIVSPHVRFVVNWNVGGEDIKGLHQIFMLQISLLSNVSEDMASNIHKRGGH